MIPLSASDPSCGMLHFLLTVTKSPTTSLQKQKQTDGVTTPPIAPSETQSEIRLSSNFHPSPTDNSGRSNPDQSVRRKTTDLRRYSTNPQTDDDASPFVVGSLKFRRRILHQRNTSGKGDESESAKMKRFEMSAPPSRKLSVPVELSVQMATSTSASSSSAASAADLSLNLERQLGPKVEMSTDDDAVTSATVTSSSRGPSRNPSPNKRTNSGKMFGRNRIHSKVGLTVMQMADFWSIFRTFRIGN